MINIMKCFNVIVLFCPLGLLVTTHCILRPHDFKVALMMKGERTRDEDKRKFGHMLKKLHVMIMLCYDVEN